MSPADPAGSVLRSRTLWLGAELILVVFALSLLVGVMPHQLDDAFITYRYAENIAVGYGPVFNPGGPWVEGFTSPLWLVLLVLGTLAGGPGTAPELAPWLGLGASALLMVAASRGAAQVGAGRREAGLAALGLLALCPTLIFYGPTGLETPAFALAVLSVTLGAVERTPHRVAIAAAIVAPWIRPEAGWLLVTLAIQWGSARLARPDGAPARRRIVRLAVCLVASGAVLLAVRWLVFGDVVPNTFHAKAPQLSDGLAYLARLAWSPAGMVFALGVWGAALGSDEHRSLGLAGASWLLAVVIEGGDWMPLGRLLLPGLVLMAVAAGGGLGRSGPRLWAGVGLYVATIAVAVPVALDQPVYAEHSRPLDLENELLGRWIETTDAPSVAAVDIGRVGYWSRADVVDLAGLTDREIAARPGPHLDKVIDLDDFFDARRPAMIVLRLQTAPAPGEGDGPPRLALTDVYDGVEQRIFADPRLPEGYSLVTMLVPAYPRMHFYGRLVFARRDFRPGPHAIPVPRVLAVPWLTDGTLANLGAR